MHFSIAMKVMIMIMRMRIIIKIMNNSNYLTVLYKILSPVLLQELINDFASTVVVHCYVFRNSRPVVLCKRFS